MMVGASHRAYKDITVEIPPRIKHGFSVMVAECLNLLPLSVPPLDRLLDQDSFC
jgi:hypothetical protein